MQNTLPVWNGNIKQFVDIVIVQFMDERAVEFEESWYTAQKSAGNNVAIEDS